MGIFIWSAISGFFGMLKNAFSGFFETKQQALLMKYLELKQAGLTEVALSQIMAQIIMAEASSPHFIVYAWRPLVALSFLAMIIGPWFGYMPHILMMKNPPMLYLKYMDYMLVFMTGYAGIRSVEKIADKFSPATRYLTNAMHLVAENSAKSLGVDVPPSDESSEETDDSDVKGEEN